MTENGKNMITDLIEHGKKEGKLTTKEINEVLEDLNFDVDQINRLYDDFETNNLDIVDDFITDEELDAALDFTGEDDLDVALSSEVL